MPPTDDPTEPVNDPPRRTRVSGAQLMEAIEALPGRIASAVGGSGDDTDDDPDDGPGDNPLPPEVTFEGEPDPTPEELADQEPPTPVASTTEGATSSARRRGFPRRRR